VKHWLIIKKNLLGGPDLARGQYFAHPRPRPTFILDILAKKFVLNRTLGQNGVTNYLNGP